MGMAQATASNGSIYTCARFLVQGNVQGQSATNGIDPNTSSGGGSSGGGPTSGDTYTVVSGDTMYLISQKFGIFLQDLEALNPQVTPPAYQINVGEVLQVSGSSSGQGGGTGAAPGGTYTVVSGDSMYLISQKLGVTLQALEAANPQVTPPAYQINVGDVLQIPGGSRQGNTNGGGGTGSGAPGGTYTVVGGDSMYTISQKLGVTLQALEAANQQVHGPAYQINVGEVLQIPGGSGQGNTAGGSTGSSGTYIVVSGDSMYAISQKLGVTLAALEAANPQVTPPSYQINVGDVLQVPGGSQGGTGNLGGGGKGSNAYTVASGDSMYSIATAHGVTLQALEAANPQVTPPQFELAVGQVITIP